MKEITIEEIAGVPHTIIWYDYPIFDSHPWNDAKYALCLRDNTYIALDDRGNHIATALPPLRRKPDCNTTQESKIEYSRLMLLYRFYGFEIYLKGSWQAADGFDAPLKEPEQFLNFSIDEYDAEWITSDYSRLIWDVEIAYVTNKCGEQVEVAII